jgi:hypothetical protein
LIASRRHLLQAYNIEPWQIIFELTENYALSNPELVCQTLELNETGERLIASRRPGSARRLASIKARVCSMTH